MATIPDYISSYKSNKKITKEDYFTIVEECRENLSIHPNDRENLLTIIAIFLMLAQKNDECIAHCKSALLEITNQESVAEFYRCYANCTFDKGEKIEALQILEKAATTAYLKEYFIDLLLDFCIELKLFEKAKDYAQYNISVGNNSWYDYENLANILHDLKEYEEAIVYYETAAKEEPKMEYDMNCKIGVMQYKLGNVEKAKQYFELSIQQNPSYETVYYNFGQLYQDEKDMYRAMHYYMKALEIEPNYPAIYNNLAALAYNEEGNIKLAISHLEKAIENKPDDTLAITIYMSLAKLYQLIADYDKSEYYRFKMLQCFGFPVSFEEGDEDGGGDDLVN